MASNDNSGNTGGLSGAARAFGMGGQDIEEETPEMRAVAIMGHSPTLHFASPSDGNKFGNVPTPGLSRPGKAKRSASAIAVKQEWNEEKWTVKDLELVPHDFPLERTHREIHDCDPKEVANRISNALRLLSVDAEYDGEKAKAKCTTSDCVSFRIRLFAGSEDGLPVVVEVQRRSGSPSSFMRICRQILDGAEGAEVKPVTEPARKKMPSFMKGPVGGMKCLKSIPLMSDPVADMDKGLNMSMELLRSKQRDSNVLGLENLCLLTDPLKTRPDIALKACKAIVLDQKCAEIREEVGVFLQKDAFLPEEFDDEDTMTLVDKARRMALVLLSNTLVLTSKDGCLATAVKSEKWFSNFLIPSLLDEVKSYETSANNAYEAACALTALATCSDIARRVMEENSAVDDLQSAYMHGSTNHELLANESERALTAMGKSL